MNRHTRRLSILLLLGAAWLLAPHIAYADNCSSLNDCYYTLRAALAAAVGLGVFAALMAIGLDIGPLTRSLKGRSKGGSGGEGVRGSEPDDWDRSLGVVSVEGMVAEHSQTPGAQQAPASTQAQPPQAAEQRVEERAAPSPDRQSKLAPEKEADLADQVPPEAETPSEEARMRQAPAEQAGPGETGRTVSPEGAGQEATGDRGFDQARGETAAEQPGRSGEWSGETGASESGAPDTGDVVDRARDVADAFDAPEAEGMTQADKPPDAEGMTQADKPPDATQEASAQATPSQEPAPSEAAQERAKPAGLQAERGTGPEGSTVADAAPGTETEAPSQTSPPSEPATAEAAEAAPAEGMTRPAGVAATPPNADVARTLLGAFGELAAIPGAQLLVRQAAVSGRWAVRGSAAELGMARALGRQGTAPGRLGDVVEGRPGADIVAREGEVIQVKNYYWDGPLFLDEESIAGATRRVVRQMELLRRRYPGREVRLAFSDLRRTPQQMGVVLKNIGVQLVRLAAARPPRPEDVVDAAFVERLRGMTAERFWRDAVAAGWDDGDRALAARVQNIFRRDAGSAWLAFSVCAFDAESIYETNPLGESYAAHLRFLSEQSGGAFAPANIAERITGEALEVSFASEGRRYASRVSAQSDWFDFRVLHAVNAALADGGEQRRFVPLPAPDQMIYLAFMTEERKRALQEAGLVPAVWPLDRQF